MAAPKGNKNAVGNEGGRPALYETPEALAAKCDEYFEYIKGAGKNVEKITNQKTGNTQVITTWEREPEPATVTGLTLFLGFADRQSLYDYGDKIEFSGIIKKARTRVENQYEQTLFTQAATGAIFALKNMGWRDKQEIDHTTKGDKITREPDLSNLSDEQLRQLAAIQSASGTSEAPLP